MCLCVSVGPADYLTFADVACFLWRLCASGAWDPLKLIIALQLHSALALPVHSRFKLQKNQCSHLSIPRWPPPSLAMVYSVTSRLPLTDYTWASPLSQSSLFPTDLALTPSSHRPPHRLASAPPSQPPGTDLASPSLPLTAPSQTWHFPPPSDSPFHPDFAVHSSSSQPPPTDLAISSSLSQSQRGTKRAFRDPVLADSSMSACQASFCCCTMWSRHRFSSTFLDFLH